MMHPEHESGNKIYMKNPEHESGSKIYMKIRCRRQNLKHND